jgi:hypothetical protein
MMQQYTNLTKSERLSFCGMMERADQQPAPIPLSRRSSRRIALFMYRQIIEISLPENAQAYNVKT